MIPSFTDSIFPFNCWPSSFATLMVAHSILWSMVTPSLLGFIFLVLFVSFISLSSFPLFMLSSVSLALGSFDESGVVNGLGPACPSVLVLGEPTTLCSPTLLPDPSFELEKCLWCLNWLPHMNRFCFIFFGLGHVLFSGYSVYPVARPSMVWVTTSLSVSTTSGIVTCSKTLITDHLTWIPLIPIILLRLSLIFMISYSLLLFCTIISTSWFVACWLFPW